MKTTLYRDNTTLRWILFEELRHAISDNCQMELIGASEAAVIPITKAI